MYSDQLRFLSKLINERQTADSLSVDNMEGSQVTTAEQNGDDMNNLSQENPLLLFNHQSFLLTVRHRASSIYDRHFATLQRTLFIYLINKYISLSDICLTVHL